MRSASLRFHKKKFPKLPEYSKEDGYTSVWQTNHQYRGNSFFWKTGSADTTRVFNSRQIRDECRGDSIFYPETIPIPEAHPAGIGSLGIQ